MLDQITPLHFPGNQAALKQIMASSSMTNASNPPRSRSRTPRPLMERNRISKVENVVVQQGPRPPFVQQLPATNDVIVSFYIYTNEASMVWRDVKDSGMPLWQVLA